jgi:tRNA(Arg) A34 adenosine deaminase TadA
MNELDHEVHMRRAIEPAGKVPTVRFGGVIVDWETGITLAEGWNRTSANPTR